MRLHEQYSVSQCECSASSKLYYRFSAIIQVRFDNKIYIYAERKSGRENAMARKKIISLSAIYPAFTSDSQNRKREKEESKTASVSALLSVRCCVHLSHCLAPTARLSECPVSQLLNGSTERQNAQTNERMGDVCRTHRVIYFIFCLYVSCTNGANAQQT